MMTEISASQSSKIVNDFLSNSVSNYENRTDTEQNLFDITENEGSLVNTDIANLSAYKKDLRFNNQYWEDSGAKKVESWSEFSDRHLSDLKCDKYLYDDGSYSVVYKKPFDIFTSLIRGEDSEIIEIQDFDKDGNKLTKSTADSSLYWNVTTYDKEGNPDISLTYSRHKTGDYTTLRDYDSSGTQQNEVNLIRSGITFRHFERSSEGLFEDIMKGPTQEISEEEYRKINNQENN